MPRFFASFGPLTRNFGYYSDPGAETLIATYVINNFIACSERRAPVRHWHVLLVCVVDIYIPMTVVV